MAESPATRADVTALLGEVDSSYIERVLDIGASVDEIGEAIRALEVTDPHRASGNRVAEVRAVLEELIDANARLTVFPS
jgi:hypothetical protein